MDIIWNFDAFQFRFLHPAERQNRKHVFHLMDYPNGADIKYQSSHADLCIGVTKGLVELLRESGATRTIHLPHSYAERPVQPIQHEALRSDRLKLAYIGNLSIVTLDLDGLTKLALQNPDIDLFLIGPRGPSNLSVIVTSDNEEFDRLVALSNVHWTGPVSWLDVPGWMDAMDALLIAYDSKRFLRKASNSHKLLEYFSSGKEILSTYLDDLEDESKLILMLDAGRSVDEGIPELREFLLATDRNDLKEKRMQFARERSYRKSTQGIFKDLQTE